MDRDIDCSVNGARCTNRAGTRDDSWSGTLPPGFHKVRVYPFGGGAGDWTITVTVDCPSGHFASGGACYRYFVPEPSSDDPPPDALAGGDPDELSCDGDTELSDDQECFDGVIVFKQEIVVTGIPIPVPPPGSAIPPPPLPPSPLRPIPEQPYFPRSLWLQPLRDAVADAVTKSRTCSVTTNDDEVKNANAALTAVRDGERIVPGGPLCGRPRTFAHVDAISGNTIHICPKFFEQSAPEMSLTLMHEGLHLAGVRHTDFGSDTDVEDPGPMDAAIRRACGYSQ